MTLRGLQHGIVKLRLQGRPGKYTAFVLTVPKQIAIPMQAEPGDLYTCDSDEDGRIIFTPTGRQA